MLNTNTMFFTTLQPQLNTTYAGTYLGLTPLGQVIHNTSVVYSYVLNGTVYTFPTNTTKGNMSAVYTEQWDYVAAGDLASVAVYLNSALDPDSTAAAATVGATSVDTFLLTQASTTWFVPDAPGPYTIQAIVTDACNPMPRSPATPLTVVAEPCPELAVVITSPTTFTISESGEARVMLTATINGVSDVDGFDAVGVRSIVWSIDQWPVIAGTPAGSLNLKPVLQNAASLQASFVPFMATDTGAYVVSLTVQDGCSTVTVQHTINVGCSLTAPPAPMPYVAQASDYMRSGNNIEVVYAPNRGAVGPAVPSATTFGLNFVGPTCNSYPPAVGVVSTTGNVTWWSRWAPPATVSYSCPSNVPYPVKVLSVSPTIFSTAGRHQVNLTLAIGSATAGIPASLLDRTRPQFRDNVGDGTGALAIFLAAVTSATQTAPCYNIVVLDAAAGKVTCFMVTGAISSATYSLDVIANGVSSRANFGSAMVYVAPPTVRRVTQLKNDRVRIEGWNVAFMPAQSPFFRPELSVYTVRGLPCLHPVVVPGELDPQFAAVECSPLEPVLQAQQFAQSVAVSVSITQYFRDPQIMIASAGAPSSVVFTTSVPWQAVMNMTSSSNSGTVNSGGVAGITVGVTILAFILVGALVWFIIHRRQANQNSAGIPTRTNPLFDRRTSTQPVPVANPLAITSASAVAPPTSRSTTEMASLPGSTQIRTVERP